MLARCLGWGFPIRSGVQASASRPSVRNLPVEPGVLSDSMAAEGKGHRGVWEQEEIPEFSHGTVGDDGGGGDGSFQEAFAR